MLLNGVHLLPDPSGALIWPRQRLVALSDPIGDAEARTAPQAAADLLRRLASLLRQRQPARVVWLGGALPALAAANRLAKREADELARLTRAHAWNWVADDLPAGLPGEAAAELTVAGLTFRHSGRPGNVLGEISADPWPLATIDGQSWPCFVLDGRRLVLPAFTGRGEGVNVLAPRFQSLFRRPFQVLMLAGGRILTRPRAKLDGGMQQPQPVSEATASTGQRLRLFGADD